MGMGFVTASNNRHWNPLSVLHLSGKGKYQPDHPAVTPADSQYS